MQIWSRPPKTAETPVGETGVSQEDDRVQGKTRLTVLSGKRHGHRCGSASAPCGAAVGTTPTAGARGAATATSDENRDRLHRGTAGTYACWVSGSWGLPAVFGVPMDDVELALRADGPSAQPPTAEYYRDKAEEIRIVARLVNSPDVTRELLQLACRFDCMAAYAERRTTCPAIGFP